MKKSFGILTALLILVLVSFLLMLVLKASNVGVKHTSDTFLKEQAELFMKSSIENSILAIEGYERNASNKCLHYINFLSPDKKFKANITILRYYCKKGSKCLDYCSDLAVPIQTTQSHGNVLLKVVVQTTNQNQRSKNKQIRISKITLQKP
jgi:hypothetical protein